MWSSLNIRRWWMALSLAVVLAAGGCGGGPAPEQRAEKETPGKEEEEVVTETDRLAEPSPEGMRPAEVSEPGSGQEKPSGTRSREGAEEDSEGQSPVARQEGEAEGAAEGEEASEEPAAEEEEAMDEQAALDEAIRSSMLVDAFNLKLEIDDSSLRLLDVRPREEYEAGHIGGAAWIDLAAWKDKALSEGGLADTEWWGETLGALGIENGTRVVVYGEAKDAARAWWLLSYLGVNHVAVLDGGLDAWLRAGELTVTAEPYLETVDFTPNLRGERLVGTGELVERHGEEGVLVLDTRSAEEFTTGHVPGALRVEWSEMLNEGGTFKSPAELRALFAAAGFTPERAVVSYCQSGGRASVGVFALELAGYGQAQNYFCSWQEWSRTEAAPVEVEVEEEAVEAGEGE